MASIKNMAMARVFKDPFGRVVSLDLHRTADLLVAGHEKGLLTIYCVYEGKKLHTLDCTKFGVGRVCYTHHAKCVLHSSAPPGGGGAAGALDAHAVRYVSHHDGRYLRFFAGHEQTVTSLSMSPRNDQFLSAGLDRKVLLWDLRTCQAQATMNVPAQPTVAMDEEGMVFAVGAAGGVVSMFDARQYGNGPFLSFPLPLERYGAAKTSPLAALEFSVIQNQMLAVVDNSIFVMDTFDGHEVARWDTGAPRGAPPMQASFSTNGHNVLSGAGDKSIKVWDCPLDASEHGGVARPGSVEPVSSWARHPALPTCARWAPRRRVAVTACHALVMWVPRDDG